MFIYLHTKQTAMPNVKWWKNDFDFTEILTNFPSLVLFRKSSDELDLESSESNSETELEEKKKKKKHKHKHKKSSSTDKKEK